LKRNKDILLWFEASYRDVKLVYQRLLTRRQLNPGHSDNEDLHTGLALRENEKREGKSAGIGEDGSSFPPVL
jgi:hypothetical protein